MKHLIKFNESQSLYIPLEEHTFRKKLRDRIVMSKSDRITIKLFLRSINYKIENGDNDFWRVMSDNTTVEALFFKTEDDWFFIEIGDCNYFKCDDMIGLIQILKDKL